MRQTDIAIVGGGLAGSTAAAMLGRAGIDTVLVDPHQQYPKDFRCEKLDASQVALLRQTGIADGVLRAATPDLHIWIARFGHLVDSRPHGQYDILYEDLVNAVRAEIPRNVVFVHAKATAISTGDDRQELTLSNGEEISARLIVLANGLNIGLRQNAGIGREILSTCHSISIGFDVRAVGRPSFDFRALTYFPERATDRMAYLSLFPIGAAMRANLFVYRDMHDPWLREMRHGGSQVLFALMPALRRLTGDFEVADVKIRPVDLYVSTGYRRAGLVLLGDAFATSCPAAGNGCNKVFTDVVRLCNAHIPGWLASAGMDADKIAAFYDDSIKTACDAACEAQAFYLRSLSTEVTPIWRARRLARYVGRIGLGALHQLRDRAPAGALRGAGAAAADTAPAE
jgi:2-polyprenyl-6-methoxyphenol hydroxylase-like FAD-dependent oxidoreductase